MKRRLNIRRRLKAARRRVVCTILGPICDWPPKLRAIGAMRAYALRMGHVFDLAHPVLFTEKRTWYALYCEHPDMTRINDKYLFKAYIEEKLGPGWTAPLYGMWTGVQDLERDWDALPNTFMLKSNCCSYGKNMRLILDKSSVDKQKLFRQARQWLDPLNTNRNGYTRSYYDVVPRIIAEKLLKSRDGHSEWGHLVNYKVQCFNGVPDHIICFASIRTHCITAYDLAWNKLPFRFIDRDNVDYERPPHLAQMIEIAAKLSQGFPQIRVDFYEAEDGLYLGEMTLDSAFRYESKEWDRKFGDKFILPPAPAK